MHAPREHYRSKYVWLWTIIIWTLLVLLLAQWKGKSSRIYSPVAATISIGSPEQAFSLWTSKGLRGRVLLLFDDYPHMRGLAFYDGAPELTNSNYVECSIFKNIIRRIYFIVEDTDWATFAARHDIGMFHALDDDSKGLNLFTMSGVPLIAVPASMLPHIDEKVLVYVNNGRFPADKVRTLLDRKRISSDMTAIYRGGNP